MVASGQKATSASINAFFGLILSSGFTQQAFVGATETTALSTYGNLTTVGPTVTITSSGSLALIYIQTFSRTSGSGSARASVAVSGASTITALTNENNGMLCSSEGLSTTANTPDTCLHLLAITPGTNTYTLQYRSTSSTTNTFLERKLIVIAP
jgi:hypothetical protein